MNKLKNLVWTAVGSAVLMTICTASAISRPENLTLASGLTAIAFAILSLREQG